MSDQVVFTKEEVESIKDTLQSTSLLLKSLEYYDMAGLCDNDVSLLDSPRPRPKVPRDCINWMIGEISDRVSHGNCAGLDNLAYNRLKYYGFDVED